MVKSKKNMQIVLKEDKMNEKEGFSMNDDAFFDAMEEEYEDYYLMQQEQKKKGNRMPKNNRPGHSGGCGTAFLIVGAIAVVFDVIFVIVFACMGRLGEVWQMQGGWFVVPLTAAALIAGAAFGVYFIVKIVRKRIPGFQKKTVCVPDPLDDPQTEQAEKTLNPPAETLKRPEEKPQEQADEKTETAETPQVPQEKDIPK